MAISTGRVAENRRARFDYQIDDTLEAGLILKGSEVKSLRTGRAGAIRSLCHRREGQAGAGQCQYLSPSRDNRQTGVFEDCWSRKQRDRAPDLIELIKAWRCVPIALYFNDEDARKFNGMAKEYQKT